LHVKGHCDKKLKISSTNNACVDGLATAGVSAVWSHWHCGQIIAGSNKFYGTLQLVSGLAEIFGTELVKNHPYTFPSGSKVAVFSWQGCTVNISFDYLLCIIVHTYIAIVIGSSFCFFTVLLTTYLLIYLQN